MNKLQVTLLAILLAVLSMEWISWPEKYRQALSVTATAEEKAAVEAGLTGRADWLKDQQHYREIADRTLLRQDRQGFQAEAENQPVGATQAQLPKFQLLGIILTEQAEPSVMIFDEQRKESRTLHIGDAIGDWELREIMPGHIVLAWNDQIEKVELRKF
ncbi:MAG: hypothetical protein KZQ95_05305 [Candidatus Thiodiazotropha sp. (ex Epidulcina cf. delphinae)]|nr:hypothetical protein [Candidatus Thiodiazotropha sp. (ex Epidulcina cf. delphinae)]